MFVSTDFLAINYGVDNTIAKYFVDREPPVNNLYWHEKLLYLRPSPGYLFIPLIVDLLFKIGIDKQQLLSEDFIHIMEQIGHISALEEIKQITPAEAIEKCTEVIKSVNKNAYWVARLHEYFKKTPNTMLMNETTPFKALHRGDVFLFSIASLDFPESLSQTIAQVWFALISTLLVLDDGDDLQSDIKTGEENSFIESGMKLAGWIKIHEMIEHNLEIIKTYNKTMAGELYKNHQKLAALPHIFAIINQS